MKKVIDRDRGFKGLVKDMRRLAKGPAVKVGVIGAQAAAPHEGDQEDGSGSKGGRPNLASVASWNHYGTDTIPARPFIAEPLDARREEIANFIGDLASKAFKEAKIDEKKALELIGHKAVSMIKTTITREKPYAPNAPSTIDRKTRAGKKGTTPLVNTGQLLNSITHEVVDSTESGGQNEGEI